MKLDVKDVANGAVGEAVGIPVSAEQEVSASGGGKRKQIRILS